MRSLFAHTFHMPVKSDTVSYLKWATFGPFGLRRRVPMEGRLRHKRPCGAELRLGAAYAGRRGV